MFPCDFVKEKALTFGLHPKLKDKIFLAGGLVPWVISSEDSNRLHSDIDFVVPLSEMETIRAFLKEQGFMTTPMILFFSPATKKRSILVQKSFWMVYQSVLRLFLKKTATFSNGISPLLISALRTAL